MFWKPQYPEGYTLGGLGALGAAAYDTMRSYRGHPRPKGPAVKTARRVGVKSKRRTASVTKNTKRRRETKHAIGEYSKVSVALGSKPKQTLSAAWQLLNQNKNGLIFNASAYQQFAGTTGICGLWNVSTSPTTGALACPVHLWDVSAVVNTNAGATQTPVVQYLMSQATPLSSSAVSWNTGGYSPVAGATLNTEKSSAALNTYQSTPTASSTLEWVQAKLLFYAPTTIPCRVSVQLVQFTDARCAPYDPNIDKYRVSPLGQFHTSFWQSMAKQYTFNPLETGDASYKKYLKVLASEDFIFQPKETTENVQAIMRQVNIFKRLNMFAKYDWSEDGPINGGLLASGIQQDVGNVNYQLHPQKRVFLMIRAQANNTTGYNQSVHPSYDIVVRSKHTQFST